MTTRPEIPAPTTSLEVRQRLVEALKLDLVGPSRTGHVLAEERLRGWERPSNGYLTGFLIPSGTPPNKSADADEGDDLGEVPESAGLAEESNEERKAAKKSFFPSSMGLSFLVPTETRTLAVLVRWGDYAQTEIEDADGKPMSVWQRVPRAETVNVSLTGVTSDPAVSDVHDSGGLQLHSVEQQIAAEDLEGHLPLGTRAVSVFLVNHRAPATDEPDVGLRLPGRARGAQRPSVCAQAGPAGGAGGRVGRAGGRPSLRRYAGVRHRPRCLGGVGHGGRWVPRAPNCVDPDRRG